MLASRPAGAVMIFTRPAGTVMIFTRSRNAAVGDNSMYCKIPNPFPSSAFGKGSATPDYSKVKPTLIESIYTCPPRGQS